MHNAIENRKETAQTVTGTLSVSANFRELVPSEKGGKENRKGIAFQDHVAAGFLIQLLEDPTLIEVWCESQDDITLVWLRSGTECVEYVQVKGQMSRPWSVALLCSAEAMLQSEQDDATVSAPVSGQAAMPKTIVEKLLANDRSSDHVEVLFRLVVRNRSTKELTPLHAEQDSQERAASNPLYHSMCDKFIDRLPNAVSPNGNDLLFWIEHARMEYVADEPQVIAVNMQKLARLIYDFHGEPLSPEQTQAFYREIVTKAFNAGKAGNASDSRCTKSEFRTWFESRLLEIVQIVFEGPPAGLLYEKMQRAGLVELYNTAYEQRRTFRSWIRSPSYMSTIDPVEVQTLVHDELLSLKLSLDLGAENPGKEFFAKCTKQLAQVGATIVASKSASLPASILHGCMFEFAGRCRHDWGTVP